MRLGGTGAPAGVGGSSGKAAAACRRRRGWRGASGVLSLTVSLLLLVLQTPSASASAASVPHCAAPAARGGYTHHNDGAPAGDGGAVMTGGLSPEAASWEKVEALAAYVAAAAASPHRGRGLTLWGRSGAHHLHGDEYKFNTTGLDLSRHNQIVRVDVERRVIHAEPMVTMEALVRAALAHGLVPKVVPPFRHATVGGSITASATSSASHRHGTFHGSCSYLTVVLGNGTVVTCSKTDRPELFHSMGGSHGSLGLVALAGIECVPAPAFVRVTYTRQSLAGAAAGEGGEALKRACGYGGAAGAAAATEGGGGATADFVDAVVFPPTGNSEPSQLTAQAWLDFDFPPQSPSGPQGGGGGGEEEEPMVPQEQEQGQMIEQEYYSSKTHGNGNEEGGDDDPDSGAEAVMMMMAKDEAARQEQEAAEEGSGEPPLPFYRAGRAFDLFYAEHLQDIHKLLSGDEGAYYTERMHIEDYLFRFDRGAFWLAKPAASFRGAPLLRRVSSGWLYPLASRWNPLARLLGRWLFSSATLFAMLRQATPDLLAARLLVATASMPIDRAASLVAFIHGTVPLTSPLYLCPARGAGARQPFAPQGHINTLFVEVGIYGRLLDDRGREHARRLEHFVAAQEGRKALCAQNFYEPHPGDFWRGFPLYNLDEYRYLRDKYAAEGVFPDIAAKVCEPLLEEERRSQMNSSLLRRYLASRRRKFMGLLL